MTPEELAILVIAAYPNHFRSQDTKTVWVNTFREALKSYDPADIKISYKITMAKWNSASFPKPEDFRRNMTGKSSTGGPGINRLEMHNFGKAGMYRATDEIIQANPEMWKTIIAAGYDFSCRCDLRDLCQRALESVYLFEQGHAQTFLDYMNPKHRQYLYAGKNPIEPLELYFNLAKAKLNEVS